MNAHALFVATLAAVALPGCFFERTGSGQGRGHDRDRDHDRGNSEVHTSVGASIEIERSYVYYPEHHAYWLEASDEWWVMGSGGWTHTRSRPQRVVINEQTNWVVVNVNGPEPQVRYSEHEREYPSNWKPKSPKGPPPGRGWRK